MTDFPADIYTEPDADLHTLRNLGPLASMAGIWEGTGEDLHPTMKGPKRQVFIERNELKPIDPQTNCPQLLYRLRYHTRHVTPDSLEMLHYPVECWLCETTTSTEL